MSIWFKSKFSLCHYKTFILFIYFINSKVDLLASFQIIVPWWPVILFQNLFGREQSSCFHQICLCLGPEATMQPQTITLPPCCCIALFMFYEMLFMCKSSKIIIIIFLSPFYRIFSQKAWGSSEWVFFNVRRSFVFLTNSHILNYLQTRVRESGIGQIHSKGNKGVDNCFKIFWCQSRF